MRFVLWFARENFFHYEKEMLKFSTMLAASDFFGTPTELKHDLENK